MIATRRGILGLRRTEYILLYGGMRYGDARMLCRVEVNSYDHSVRRGCG